jgi:Dual-action HEIGH metallo-peptidase
MIYLLLFILTTPAETNQIKTKDMRKFFKPFAIATLAIFIISSCSKEKQDTMTEEITQETLSKIAALGFSRNEVQRVDGGYLVEGDIILSEKDLSETPSTPRLRIAEVEQYSTFNLVENTPRTITVTTSGGNINALLSDGINAAIARYNAEKLSLTFVRGGSNGGGDINIRVVNTGQYIASAGFPNGGDPFNEIKYAKTYTSSRYNVNFVTTVLTHEMGHCIGFRHTDYMNRAYSCGSGGSEGQDINGVGAVAIPGTPTGPDAASFMLACLSATTNRPFNANDIVALNYLY